MAKATLRAAYAKSVLSQHLLKKYNRLNHTSKTTLPQAHRHELLGGAEVTTDFTQPICIIGAGAAGLSAAVMLQVIGFTNITILEATSRVGGRCYTYQFTNGPSCNHNYYDVGAMRIPQIDTQDSTMNMIKWLNQNGETVATAPYIYNNGNEPSSYEWPADDTGFDTYMTQLLTAQGFLTPSASGLASKATAGETFDQAFWNFINSSSQPDKYSTRAWLMLGPAGPNPLWDYMTTEKAETFDTSTGLFDQAFMETICDWFDFKQAKTAPWKRIEGGMSVLTDALHDYATKHNVTVATNTPVTAMKDNGQTISVTFVDPSQKLPTDYSAVFNTTTFVSLQRMDLSGLALLPENICAIRALSYDRATKVAVKFKSAWWIDLIPNGGVSNTDLPISNVVYPSWNDGPDSAYTIIVSYSWAQDATRMASLIQTNGLESTDVTDPIVHLCFQDLVKLWSKQNPALTMDTLKSSYSAHMAFAWSHGPYTAGGFALFGPGQFEFLYPQFTVPLCENKLSICGEAVSAHHAWISGAFDSSYNAILAWCIANKYTDAEQRLLQSPFAGGENQNTAEFDENLLLWNLALKLQQSKQTKLKTQT